MDRESVRLRLHDFICGELLRNPGLELAEDEPLITGGLIDSHSLVHIAVFVEEVFGVYIPDTDLTVENLDTLGAMVDRVLAGG